MLSDEADQLSVNDVSPGVPPESPAGTEGGVVSLAVVTLQTELQSDQLPIASRARTVIP